MKDIEDAIKEKTDAFKSLSADEERALLQLTDDQKRMILEADKAAKNGFLAETPRLSHATLKTHDKYKAFEASIGSAGH